jgi:hypothetical protein
MRGIGCQHITPEARHGFALAASIHVGQSPADRGFAARAGLAFEPIS